MWRIIMLCVFMNFATATIIQGNFTNYTVIFISQATSKQLKNLNRLGIMINNMTYKGEPISSSRGYTFLVEPLKLFFFYHYSIKMGLSFQTITDNFIEWFDVVKRYHLFTPFNFTRYHTLTEINMNLINLNKSYPHNVETISLSSSFEGRDIIGVKVSFKPNNPGIIIEGGIHGNEWISPAIIMYVLFQLLNSNDTNVRELAERHDWHIFPLFNPDGYEYTHNTNRNWSKNRRKHDPCFGVDLDKNWAYKLNSLDKHKDILNKTSCENDYSGTEAFSEPETWCTALYMNHNLEKFYAYISFRGYGPYLLYPYCYTKKYSKDYDDLHAIATKMVAALKYRHGTVYRMGTVAEVTGESTGCSIDYVHNIYKKHLVFQYRLGNITEKEESSADIVSIGEEVVDSLIAMFKEAQARGYPKK